MKSMKLRYKLTVIVALFLGVAYSCKEEPKYTPISSEKNSSTVNTMDPNGLGNKTLSNELHTVVVKEVLPTTKYVYLNVEENGEQFWIATMKQEVKVGETYYYKRSLLKTNFESKEYNRTFDKIYLVTSLVGANHGKEQPSMNTNNPVVETAPIAKPIAKPLADSQRNIVQKGSIKIAELVENFKKYEGKTIQITGECVKVNSNIMDRNWIHLKDGSKDDYDLVITSDVFVPEGKIVTMKGLVTLNKDFGAGYKYDLILENGSIVP